MRRATLRHAGFTMIEMTIALAGTVIIFALVMFGTNRAFDTWEGTVASAEIERMANQSMDRMISVLADASTTTIAEDLSAPDGGSTITFQQRTGFASGSVVWGPKTVLQWASDPDDPRDDKDNDGDGLIDEGEILMTDADGQRVVIARNVTEFLQGETDDSKDENGNGLEDEQGLCFELDGALLVIRLTLSKRGADGEIVTRSSEGSIRLLD